MRMWVGFVITSCEGGCGVGVRGRGVVLVYEGVGGHLWSKQKERGGNGRLERVCLLEVD